MQLLLMADGAVGLSILEWLAIEWPNDLGLVVTTSENQISEVARRYSVDTAIFSSQASLATYVRNSEIKFDLGLMAWWPKIIGPEILSIPASGFVNTHPSLLPYNRGKHYNFWALVENAPFGVTLHRVDEGVDTGCIIAQQSIPYTWEDTGASLYAKAQTAMLALLKATYHQLRQPEFHSTPQAAHQGSFHKASELNEASQIHLDKEYKARDLLNLIRARTFKPHPACWFVEQEATYEVRIEIIKL